MNIAQKSTFVLNQRDLLGIEGLSREEILGLLDLAEHFVDLNRQIDKKQASLRGRTLINLFFEVSTRTQASFELAGKRLGADVMNMSVGSSSMRKGETLIDTAITLNAMHPDIIVVRHHASGAVELLAKKVDCSVINAGDGSHEHPTQALLDALTIRRNKGRIERLVVAICGDILHSRVARSNIHLLTKLGATVSIAGPGTLVPNEFGELVEEGDYSGFGGAARAMAQPGVDIAVLETARGGILLRGIGTLRAEPVQSGFEVGLARGLQPDEELDELVQSREVVLREYTRSSAGL